MEIDLHQLELRHRDLRIHDRAQRQRLIGSVAEIGQQVPIVVIRDADRLVLIDGYLRVEALQRLQRDRALATTWPLDEVAALVHHRHLAAARRAALEDAWLLGRLRAHGLTQDQVAQRLCRSTSWVSRRLALLDVLGPAAHARVRAGTVPAHAAMKYLVPLARANRRQCEALLAGLGDTPVTVRELEALYAAWKRADRSGRERLTAEPLLALRALAAQAAEADAAVPVHKELTMLAALALRTARRVRDGARFGARETHAWRAACEAFATLSATVEDHHAGPAATPSHPDPA